MSDRAAPVAEEMLSTAKTFERLALRTALRVNPRDNTWCAGFDDGTVLWHREHARSLRRYACDLLDDTEDGLLGRALLAEWRRSRTAA